MSENFWLGNTEYIIRPYKGAHAIFNVYDYENDLPSSVVFVGHYDECLEEKVIMIAEHYGEATL